MRKRRASNKEKGFLREYNETPPHLQPTDCYWTTDKPRIWLMAFCTRFVTKCKKNGASRNDVEKELTSVRRILLNVQRWEVPKQRINMDEVFGGQWTGLDGLFIVHGHIPRR